MANLRDNIGGAKIVPKKKAKKANDGKEAIKAKDSK